MSNELSKTDIYKYVPFGNLYESIPYLLRRLYENKDSIKYLLKIIIYVNNICILIVVQQWGLYPTFIVSYNIDNKFLVYFINIIHIIGVFVIQIGILFPPYLNII